MGGGCTWRFDCIIPRSYMIPLTTVIKLQCYDYHYFFQGKTMKSILMTAKSSQDCSLCKY